MLSGSSSEYKEDALLGIKPRAFDKWPISENPLPCFVDDESAQETREGFMYLKPYKTGSSTSAGIQLRIARNVARRKMGLSLPRDTSDSPGPQLPQHQLETVRCRADFDHGPWGPFAGHKMYSQRIKGKSFLWSIIREPTDRVISMFFHMPVSRHNIEPTDRNFKHFILEEQVHLKHDYYLNTLSMKTFPYPAKDSSTRRDVANQILQDYDFIGVTERMEESAVALAMLLGLPLADVLYLAVKVHGGYDNGGYNETCVLIKPSFVSDGMRDFFSSAEWQERVKYDRALHNAAHLSLDMTIARLGREDFAEKHSRFKQAVTVARERCQPNTIFSCTKDGRPIPIEKTDCIWGDAGCNFACLDEVSTEFGLW